MIKFIKRVRKIDGDRFFDLLFFTEEFDHSKLTLRDLCVGFYKNCGITISPQGLNDKFNDAAVCYMKLILEKLINQMSTEHSESFKKTVFNKIRIKDATSFQLPQHMKDKYPGSGGDGSDACIKIQFEYDLKSGKIIDLTLTPYNTTDSYDALKTVNNIMAGDLVIRDLGYQSMLVNKMISNNSAYYISRLNPNLIVYQLKREVYKRLNFKAIIRWMKINNISVCELEVYVSEEKQKTRLVIELMPFQEVEKRLRTKQREANKKGRQMSDELKTRIELNLFITNVPEDILNITQIHALYKTRWQIELVFKTWKSILDIDNVNKKMKIQRFECFLLGKLAWAVVHTMIFVPLNNYIFKTKNKILSYYKTTKVFKQNLASFFKCIKENQIEQFIDLIKNLIGYCYLDQKKDKEGFIQILKMFA